MIARKLTIEQKENIHGVFFNETTFFNCVQDVNNDWFIFLSESDIKNLGDFNYLLEIVEENFTPKPQTNPFE
jgi:hypothetical protein